MKDKTEKEIKKSAENEEIKESTEEIGTEKNNEKKGTKISLGKIILFAALGVFVVSLFVLSVYAYVLLKKTSQMEAIDPNDIVQIEQEDISETPNTSIPSINPEDLATPVPTTEFIPQTNEDYGVINIAVFGVDNRFRKSFSGRSDVNIILTLDLKNNEVRLTSIMRDTLIYLPSQEDFNRINAAIVYEEGPEGAVAVIEQEFNINIDHFIVTSFRGVKEIIESIGGVTVYVSTEELWQMNGLIQEMNNCWGYNIDNSLLSKEGTQRLNGIQTVAYTRIRKEDGGIRRDERQKEVLAAAREKLSGITLSELDGLVNTVVEWVKTDMEPLELLALAKELYGLKDGNYRAIRVPFDEHSENARYENMSIIQFEKEYTLEKMHDFIYKGIDP